MQAGAKVGVRSRCQSKLAATVTPPSAPNRYTPPWLVTIGTPSRLDDRLLQLQLQLQLLLEDSIPPTLTTFEMAASLHHLLPLLHVFSSTHHMSGVVPSLHHVRAPQPMVLRRVSVCRCACSACSSAKGEGEAGGLSAQRAYRVSCVCRVSSCLCHRMPFSSNSRASVSLVHTLRCLTRRSHTSAASAMLRLATHTCCLPFA